MEFKRSLYLSGNNVEEKYLAKNQRPAPRTCDTCSWLERLKARLKEQGSDTSELEKWVTSSEMHYMNYHYAR